MTPIVLFWMPRSKHNTSLGPTKPYGFLKFLVK